MSSKAKKGRKPQGALRPNLGMERRAVQALHATWAAIAYDVLACDGPERVVLSGEEVQDTVSSCGFTGGYPADYGRDPEAVRWLESLTWDEQERVLEAAFPGGRRYGL